jgi:transcriptional regulator with XRE-family HTH domain
MTNETNTANANASAPDTTESTTENSATVAKTTETPKYPGSALIAALWYRASVLGHRPVDIAQACNISYNYLMLLARGERPVPRVDRDHLVSMAAYLEIPVAQAFLLAEALSPKDFVRATSLDRRIEDAYLSMRANPHCAGIVGTIEEWEATPLNIKMLACFLFEQCYGFKFTDVVIPSSKLRSK